MYLTKRQKEILDYIRAYIEQREYAPTLEEIGAQFGLSSPATVYKHVQQLVRKGYLRKAKHQGRGLELVDVAAEKTIVAPLRGQLGKSTALDVGSANRSVNLPPGFAGSSPLYCLEVCGDELKDELLVDGDLLVIEERTAASNGETVVAVLQDRQATVGRYYLERGLVRLQQRALGSEPVFLPETQVRVTGVVVGLLRRYS